MRLDAASEMGSRCDAAPPGTSGAMVFLISNSSKDYLRIPSNGEGRGETVYWTWNPRGGALWCHIFAPRVSYPG